MIPKTQIYNSQSQVQGEHTQINETTHRDDVKSSGNQQGHGFKSIHVNSLREISLPKKVNEVITTNRKLIFQYEKQIKKIEKELSIIRYNKDTAQLEKAKLITEINDNKPIDQDLLSHLNKRIEKLKEKELKQINEISRFQRIIMLLEERIKNDLGKWPIPETQVEQLLFSLNMQAERNTHINEITRHDVKTSETSQGDRFKSIDVKDVREFFLPRKVYEAITTNRKTIIQCEKHIKKIEKKLFVIRQKKDTARLEKAKLKSEIASNKPIDQALFSKLEKHIKNLKEKELKQINERFRFQRIITLLNAEIKKELGQLPITKVQFGELVQIHGVSQSSPEKQYPLQVQLLEEKTNRGDQVEGIKLSNDPEE